MKSRPSKVVVKKFSDLKNRLSSVADCKEQIAAEQRRIDQATHEYTFLQAKQQESDAQLQTNRQALQQLNDSLTVVALPAIDENASNAAVLDSIKHHSLGEFDDDDAPGFMLCGIDYIVMSDPVDLRPYGGTKERIERVKYNVLRKSQLTPQGTAANQSDVEDENIGFDGQEFPVNPFNNVGIREPAQTDAELKQQIEAYVFLRRSGHHLLQNDYSYAQKDEADHVHLVLLDGEHLIEFHELVARQQALQSKLDNTADVTLNKPGCLNPFSGQPIRSAVLHCISKEKMLELGHNHHSAVAEHRGQLTREIKETETVTLPEINSRMEQLQQEVAEARLRIQALDEQLSELQSDREEATFEYQFVKLEEDIAKRKKFLKSCEKVSAYKSYMQLLQEQKRVIPCSLNVAIDLQSQSLKIATCPVLIDGEFVIDYDDLQIFWHPQSSFLGSLFSAAKDLTGINPFTGEAIKHIELHEELCEATDNYVLNREYMSVLLGRKPELAQDPNFLRRTKAIHHRLGMFSRGDIIKRMAEFTNDRAQSQSFGFKPISEDKF